jgi:hypothetical protein
MVVMAAPDLIVLDVQDNVGTALRDLERGAVVRVSGVQGDLSTLLLAASIGLGHKAALVTIAEGSMVVKHGHPIGKATADIAAGEHVHIHNVISLSLDDAAAIGGQP